MHLKQQIEAAVVESVTSEGFVNVQESVKVLIRVSAGQFMYYLIFMISEVINL